MQHSREQVLPSLIQLSPLELASVHVKGGLDGVRLEPRVHRILCVRLLTQGSIAPLAHARVPQHHRADTQIPHITLQLLPVRREGEHLPWE